MSSEFRASDTLELLHTDMCGPISPQTFSGKKYFLLVVDDCTRYMWIVLIKSKDEALLALKKIKNSTENELNLKVKAIRTDRGGEFTSHEFSRCATPPGDARTCPPARGNVVDDDLVDDHNCASPEGSISKGYGTKEVIEFCVDFIPDLKPIGVPESRHKERLSGKGTL
ncbi:hypothetical protein QYE76_050959 [Lolium multiflorum]|uniref:Integrase catalytic domain-containing protein n=1 Tax=Lolium multiflorum TaxID=4521 RepID=A0AAD8WK30_LOLMU|nr:hypothetical protein QYE76_050959 [Lolium multiflorum]